MNDRSMPPLRRSGDIGLVTGIVLTLLGLALLLALALYWGGWLESGVAPGNDLFDDIEDGAILGPDAERAAATGRPEIRRA